MASRKQAIAALSSEGDGADFSDIREARVMAITDAQIALRTDVERLFSGTDIATDVETIDFIIDRATAINADYTRYRTAYATICASLVALRERVGKAGFRTLLKNNDKFFPFSQSQTSKYLIIGTALAEGRIPENAMPGDIEAAYLLSSLAVSELGIAEKRQLIRPSVSRKELLELKRDLRSRLLPPDMPVDINWIALREPDANRAKVRRERDKVERELREVLAKARMLNARRRELRIILGR